ncbi:hypothetical protein BC830DRAFT_1114340 [Chytriomyces sp. MP71]|nr:hypothetical protein BC830DRAFT_1114340 [Chytriomyces sp. MP71]
MSLTASQIFAIAVVEGLVTEVSLSGLLQVLYLRHRATKAKAWKDPSYRITSTISIAFNISAISYAIIFMPQFFFVGSNCRAGSMFVNFLSHCTYFTFDCFTCFKTYLYSDGDPRVKWCTIAILSARIGVAALDIYSSYSVWDGNLCNYIQWPASGIAYNTLDIFIDLYCTIVSIQCATKFLEWDFTRIGEIIINENIIRSAVMLGVNLLEIYVSYTVANQYFLFIAYTIQNLAYTRLLNLEGFWIEERHKSYSTPQNETSVFNQLKALAQASSAQDGESTRNYGVGRKGRVVRASVTRVRSKVSVSFH